MLRPTSLSPLRGVAFRPQPTAQGQRIALASLRTSARSNAFAKPSAIRQAANPQSGKPASDNLKVSSEGATGRYERSVEHDHQC